MHDAKLIPGLGVMVDTGVLRDAREPKNHISNRGHGVPGGASKLTFWIIQRASSLSAKTET